MTDEILGYYKDGKPIYETKRGYIYTAAVISCDKCRTIIRGMGGPAFGSLCAPCYETKKKEQSI